MLGRTKPIVFNLESYQREVFENQTVLLDGKRFIDCTFRNCTLEFRGTSAAVFLGRTVVEECDFPILDGAAATLDFLSTLYTMMPEYTETMLQQIRQKKPTRDGDRMRPFEA